MHIARKNPPLSLATRETSAMRRMLIAAALIVLLLFLFLPLAVIFREALRMGWQVYLDAIAEPYAVAAIRLTLVTATDKAQAAFPVIREINRAWQEAITRGMSGEEKDTLLKLLEMMKAEARRLLEEACP